MVLASRSETVLGFHVSSLLLNVYLGEHSMAHFSLGSLVTNRLLALSLG